MNDFIQLFIDLFQNISSDNNNIIIKSTIIDYTSIKESSDKNIGEFCGNIYKANINNNYIVKVDTYFLLEFDKILKKFNIPDTDI